LSPKYNVEILHQLNTIIHFFEHIQKVNTDNVPPLYNILQNSYANTRSDEPETQPTHEMLKQAPKIMDGYYVVPKVKDVDLS